MAAIGGFDDRVARHAARRWQGGRCMGDVTVLLEAARQGQPLALGQIFDLLYPELKRMAHARLRWRDDRLLMETGMLVHEAYLRLLEVQRLGAADRSQFLAYASRVMRSVVVDVVREQQSQRRGGGPRGLVTLDTAAFQALPSPGEAEILRIHEALEELALIDPRLVQVVEMRYFVGLDNQEIADCLGLTTRTVERDWQKARSFLYRSMNPG
jgi:RNA polymerase sigma factor (TIGR02999 family)